jgi:diamine N-acetyltransferase
MAIHLEKIDRNNVDEVCDLEVFDEQEDYVASNAYSLAEASVKPEMCPLAVYNDGELVGFVMYCLPCDEYDEYWVIRLMIDKRHQRKGYGGAVMRLVPDIIKADTRYNEIFVSFEPGNVAARKLYEGMGFAPDGRVIDGEIVYVLKY